MFTLTYTRILGSRALNEFRFGFNRSHILKVGEDGARARDFGFNINNPSDFNFDLIPNISIGRGAVSTLGVLATLPNQRNVETFQFVDSFSFTRGGHSIRLGADVRRNRMNIWFPIVQSGLMIFTGIAAAQFDPSLRLAANPLLDFALGRPTVSFNFEGNAARGFRYSSLNFYFQDDIQVTPNLTINAGIRYELNTVLDETGGRLMVWRPALLNTPTKGLFIIGDNTGACRIPCETLRGAGGPYGSSPHNFAPRVGFAYSPFAQRKSRRTVIRGGYGLFWDTVQGRWLTNLMHGPPFLNSTSNLFPSFPDSFGPGKSFGGRASFPSPPVFTTFDESFKFPYIQHWDLTIQQAITNNLTFEVAYVGTKGTRLSLNNEINQPITDPKILGRELTPADAATRDARRPFLGIGSTNYFESGDNSSYNSLQVKATQRFSRGLTFAAAYNYSKSIDYKSELEGSLASNINVRAQNNYDRRAERGVSDFDLTHRFTFNFVYLIPSLRNVLRTLPDALADGWQISGIATIQSGNPFSVWTGTDRSLTGVNADRPDLVGNPAAGPRTVNRWFNTSAFALNDWGKFGNAGRNILRSPRFVNFDFAIQKETTIREQHRIQFRAEFFNIFNRPNFSIPSNVLLAPNFGALFQTPDVAQGNVGLGSGGPRLIQFGLKYIF